MVIKEIILNGVGFKAYKLENYLLLNLGKSHYIKFLLTNNIQVKVKKNKILLISFNKQELGEISQKLVYLKKPDSYNLIGVQTKFLKKKPGKKR